MHSLWYHDHRIDYTAQNVYKGLAGCTTSSIRKTPRTTRVTNTGFRLPSSDYDINMVFNDAVYDAEIDQLAFDLFNLDGILGDKMLVNGKVFSRCSTSARAAIDFVG